MSMPSPRRTSPPRAACSRCPHRGTQRHTHEHTNTPKSAHLDTHANAVHYDSCSNPPHPHPHPRDLAVHREEIRSRPESPPPPHPAPTHTRHGHHSTKDTLQADTDLVAVHKDGHCRGEEECLPLRHAAQPPPVLQGEVQGVHGAGQDVPATHVTPHNRMTSRRAEEQRHRDTRGTGVRS